MARVFVLEDEPFLRAELVDFLEERGHRATAVGSLAEFRSAWPGGMFDIAIVDRVLPDGDGLDAVAAIRAAGGAVWIIMLTGRGEVAERVEGLGTGADHYLVKPVRLEVLAATVEALVRRIEGTPEPRRWVLDTADYRLFPPGRGPVPLTSLEFAVLRCLVQAHRHPVKRHELALAFGVNPDEFDRRRLDTEMSRLRRKVHAESGLELPVQTVQGVGYVFAADAVLK